MVFIFCTVYTCILYICFTEQISMLLTIVFFCRRFMLSLCLCLKLFSVYVAYLQFLLTLHDNSWLHVDISCHSCFVNIAYLQLFFVNIVMVVFVDIACLQLLLLIMQVFSMLFLLTLHV